MLNNMYSNSNMCKKEFKFLVQETIIFSTREWKVLYKN